MQWLDRRPVPEIGSIAIVESGLMHVAGRVIQPAREGRVWLDCNIMGSHLPQMYQPGEIAEVTSPPEVQAHGMCQQCLGFGIVYDAGQETFCSACGGSGRPGLKVDVTATTSGKEASVEWEPALAEEITCEVCRKAFTLT